MLDIAVIAIIILMAYHGSKTGLVRSVFNLGYFIIAALISAIAYPLVSTMLINTSLAGIIRDKVSKWLVLKGSGVTDSLPEFLSRGINKGVANASDALATSLTQTFLNLISVLIVFLIVRLGLKFAVKLLNIVTSMPVIKGLDKMGGTLIGVLNGFIIVYFLLGVAAFFVSSGITDLIKSSYLTNIMYHNNILLKLIFR